MSHEFITVFNVFSVYFVFLLIASVPDHIIWLATAVAPSGPLHCIFYVLIFGHLLFSLLPLESLFSLYFLSNLVGSQALELRTLFFLLFVRFFCLEGVKFKGVVSEGCLKVWMVEFAHKGLKFLVVNLIGFEFIFGVDFFEFAFNLVERHFLELLSEIFNFLFFLLFGLFFLFFLHILLLALFFRVFIF